MTKKQGTELAIVEGSLRDLAKSQNTSLADIFTNVDLMVLVDTSGSMDAPDSRGGRKRYDVAVEELTTLQRSEPGRIAVIAFSDKVEFCPGGVPRYFGSGTDMANALRFARQADVPGVRFVLISDGEPTNPEHEVLAEAERYINRIDTIFVGPEAQPYGRDFLMKLAKVKGGVGQTADRVMELASKTRMLLLEASHG